MSFLGFFYKLCHASGIGLGRISTGLLPYSSRDTQGTRTYPGQTPYDCVISADYRTRIGRAPLLFIIYIIYTSDLPLCIPPNCSLFMYADDSTLTCSSSSINEIENILNIALARIHNWSVRNKLTINANKTKSMLIGSRQRVSNTDLNVSIADSPIVKVNSCKCLGVIIDETLSWTPHVE